MRIGAVIQARMGSCRLPGKVLRPLGDRPLLAWLLERLRRCRGLDVVAVATSTRAEDDAVAAFCERCGVACTRGPAGDVAGRLAAAARTLDLGALVRLCGDSPLLDPALVTRAVAVFRAADLDLVTNVFPRTFPPGQSVEVLRTATLVAAAALMRRDDEREHVTPFLYRHASRYRIRNLPARRDYGGLDFAVDTPADLRRLEALVAALDGPPWHHGLDALADAWRARFAARAWRHAAAAT